MQVSRLSAVTNEQVSTREIVADLVAEVQMSFEIEFG